MDLQLVRQATELAVDLSKLESAGIRRTRHGYYYIAHYYPLRAMEPVNSETFDQLLGELEGTDFETYLHFPFCEAQCSFCHFHKHLVRGESARGKFSAVIDSAVREINLYGDRFHNPKARSFYLGGGTPSLIPDQELTRVFRALEENFDCSDLGECKFEVFPKKHSRAKLISQLQLLRSFGATDIVVDLESGNPASLQAVGRGMTSLEYYLDVVELCVSMGFESIVTGLIIGLPHETFQSLGNTLATLASIPEVKVINTFPLITREPDLVARQVARSPERFPSLLERDALWIFARNFLISREFKEGPVSYYSRLGKVPRQQRDKFECVNLIGFGPSGFGYLNGEGWAAQYFNQCRTGEYINHVDQGRFPVWRAGVMGQEERARRKLIFGLANCGWESLADIDSRFGVDSDALFGEVLDALDDLQLIEFDRKTRRARYKAAGLARLEEISYFLSSKEVQAVCGEAVDPAEVSPEMLRHHYYILVPKEDRVLFESMLAQRAARSRPCTSGADLEAITRGRPEDEKVSLSS